MIGLASTPIPPLLLLPGSQYVSTNSIGRDVTAVQESAAKKDYTTRISLRGSGGLHMAL